MKFNHTRVTITTLILLALLAMTPWYTSRLIAGLGLMGFLPGYALFLALWPDDPERALSTRLGTALLAVPVSYTLTVVTLLVMAFLGLPFNRVTVVGGLFGLSLLLTVIAWLRSSNFDAGSHPASLYPGAHIEGQQAFAIGLITIVLLALLFRMINVSYSDHQGDEADILLRAVGLVHGDVERLLTHSKGPGEILLLNAIGAITGQFDEYTARLPFSVAGAAGVGLITLLAALLFNPLTGFVAGVLAAIDGVFVSYARTAQYQSVVLLLTVGAMLNFYRFYQTGGQSRRLHASGALLLAGAFLFHFETILLLPVVVFLTVAHLGWPELKATGQSLRDWSPKIKETLRIALSGRSLSDLGRLWPSAALFLALVAIFYIPFLLHPNLGKTGSYLDNRINSGSFPPFNNLDHFFYREAIKYNAAQYAAFFDIVLLIFAGIALVRLGRKHETRKWSLWSFLCLGGIGGGTLLALAGLEKPSALLVGVGFALFFLLVIFALKTPSPERMLWLWIAPPFWAYVFLVNRAGKHHYLFLAAMIIFLGLAVTQFWAWVTVRRPGLNRPLGRWLALALSLAFLGIFAGHTIMVLMRGDLEYILTYPEHKSAFYPADAAFPYDTRIGFGYPFRLGWQVVGHLKRTGQLDGAWGGNDAGNAPNWYMLNTPASPCYPDYVLRGEITYKGDGAVDVPFHPENFGYVPRYRIWGNDRLRMTILAFDPMNRTAEPIDLYERDGFEPAVTATDFLKAGSSSASVSPPEILLTPPLILGEGSELKNNAPAEYLERAQQLEGRLALIGYDLELNYALPGGVLPITLHWQAQNVLSLRYKVFVHLISAEGQLWAQADDFPVCGASHANSWSQGRVVRDRHLLMLPPDIPPGDYSLRVGMYEPDLNLRLNYIDIANNEQGNSLTLGTATIR